MKKAILLILIFALGIKLDAQSFKEQRREFVFANIGINGIVGGLGALVNKKKNEKPLKVFAKGFGQGCLGGTFQLLGKELTYQINTKENLSYAWAARITNSIGNSITQNAASNINFWERWHFNLGVLRFDYHITNNKFQARLFPSSIYGIIVGGSQAKLNFKRSLQTGIMIFERDGNVRALGGLSIGVGAVSSIAINKNVQGKDYYSLMAHEVMHILQYDNMVWVNPFLNKLDNKLKSNNSFYQKASKYIYFDFNGMTIFGLYMLQINKPWECRFIEREADHFSREIHWPTCN